MSTLTTDWLQQTSLLYVALLFLNMCVPLLMFAAILAQERFTIIKHFWWQTDVIDCFKDLNTEYWLSDLFIYLFMYVIA